MAAKMETVIPMLATSLRPEQKSSKNY